MQQESSSKQELECTSWQEKVTKNIDCLRRKKCKLDPAPDNWLMNYLHFNLGMKYIFLNRVMNYLHVLFYNRCKIAIYVKLLSLCMWMQSSCRGGFIRLHTLTKAKNCSWTRTTTAILFKWEAKWCLCTIWTELPPPLYFLSRLNNWKLLQIVT